MIYTKDLESIILGRHKENKAEELLVLGGFIGPAPVEKISQEKIRSKITYKTKVIIPVHLYGQSCEMSKILEIANRYKIKLISIVSKKNSLLYKASDIKLLLPEVQEAGYGIVPTASTSVQLSIGDALAISLMHYKKFSKLDCCCSRSKASSKRFSLKRILDST